MSEDLDSYANRVRADHYLHWLAVITAAVWAGTIYGWLVGAGVLIELLVAISVSNTIILARSGSIRATKINRWVWVLLAFLVIVMSSAEVHTVQT